MASDRIAHFLKTRNPEGPCLIVDKEIVRDNYFKFARALPDTRVYYAVKANPAPELITMLVELGCCFDVASLQEIDLVMDAGADPVNLSFGNTIKKERDIAAAYGRGVRLFAVDSHEEVDKIIRQAPGSKVFCRILTQTEGAEWPLSRKFGCCPDMAMDVLDYAHRHGLQAYGLSFHVGSQMVHTGAWDQALSECARIFRTLSERGIDLSMVNLGGGFPTRYTKDVPETKAYGEAILESIYAHFGNRIPETIIEPGPGHGGQCRNN
jgi:ornithine decarboxylase